MHLSVASRTTRHAEPAVLARQPRSLLARNQAPHYRAATARVAGRLSGDGRLKLALFDLDNTLLDGDSDFEWAQFLIEQGVLDREVYESRNQAFFEQYKQGTLDIHEFLDFQLKPLSRHPRRVLDAWHGEFMAGRILPMIRASARELVAKHAGDTRAIVTATNSFVTAPIAREFGIDNLIATEPEHAN